MEASLCPTKLHHFQSRGTGTRGACGLLVAICCCSGHVDTHSSFTWRGIKSGLLREVWRQRDSGERPSCHCPVARWQAARPARRETGSPRPSQDGGKEPLAGRGSLSKLQPWVAGGHQPVAPSCQKTGGGDAPAPVTWVCLSSGIKQTWATWDSLPSAGSHSPTSPALGIVDTMLD